METTELVFRTDHPPHAATPNKNGILLPRFLRGTPLFIALFLLSLSLPHFISVIQDFSPGHQERDQTIREIITVLDRHHTELGGVKREKLAEAIYEESIQYDYDPKFILALIAIESSFQNRSVSERGAMGLMQIMPFVAESLAREMGIEWHGEHALFDPLLNVRMGIYYLSRLLIDFNDLGTALAAYNYGPTYIKSLVTRKRRIPLQYYRKIQTVYKNLYPFPSTAQTKKEP